MHGLALTGDSGNQRSCILQKVDPCQALHGLAVTGGSEDERSCILQKVDPGLHGLAVTGSSEDQRLRILQIDDPYQARLLQATVGTKDNVKFTRFTPAMLCFGWLLQGTVQWSTYVLLRLRNFYSCY